VTSPEEADRDAVIQVVTVLSQELLFGPKLSTFLGQHVLDVVDVQSLSVQIARDRIEFALGIRGRWESHQGRSGTATLLIPRSDGSGLSRWGAASYAENFLVQLAEDLQSPGSPSSHLDWHPVP
jgi:hypothetical protein